MNSIYDHSLDASEDARITRVRERAREMLERSEIDDETRAFLTDCARIADYARGLQVEVRDLDILYSTTVEHATGIENELMRRNKEVGDFLANMSHELRTPLNAIIGYGEMALEVAEEDGLDQVVDELRRIARAGRHLLRLINDVLDLSKIEAGRMELAPEQLDVPRLVGEVVDTVRPLARDNHTQLEVHTAPDVGTMYADPTRLRQCLTNLVGNACKFTRHGTVRVTAVRDADRVLFSVSDTGIGMTSDQLERLFRPFVQAEVTTSRRFGGTGLGLALTHRLTHAMGGTIEVSSEPGKGSTFTIALPVRGIPPTPRPHDRR